MKTIIIWNDYENINFFVLDGNFLHFDNIYIKSYTIDAEELKLQDELTSIVYDDEGQCIVDMLTSFPHEMFNNLSPGEEPARVIVSGFIP